MNPLAFIADERVDPVEIFHIANIQKRSLYTRPGLVALLSINPYICKMDRLPVLIQKDVVVHIVKGQPEQILRLIAGSLCRIQKSCPAGRGPSQAEAPYGLVLEAAALEIGISERPALARFELLGEVVLGELRYDVETLALLPCRDGLCALLLFLNLDAKNSLYGNQLTCIIREFSFKKLLKVGSSALITAGTQCIGMFTLGIIAGSAMGWSSIESLFLGGIMSMSSTSIIIKAYNDMGLKDRPYAGLLFGSLVVQDLIAVLLMVLLSTIAIAVVCFVLGAMILFFLTFALAYWIGQLANSMAIGFLTISAVLTLSMFIFYKNRTRWIIHPLFRLVANLFVSGEEESTEEQDENEQTGI